MQLDSDPQASSFDAIVAVDAGADVILPYGDVTPENIRGLIYGAMFTRGVSSLKSSAAFIGGSDVEKGEALLEAARESFFGPLSISLMLDSGGANTTAAAAVVAALDHIEDPVGRRALVLGSTGPVGRRVTLLLAHAGFQVRAGSRSLARSMKVVEHVKSKLDAAQVDTGQVDAVETSTSDLLARALEGVSLVVAAGKLGVQILPESVWSQAETLRVAIDLNAVPPAGIEAVAHSDQARDAKGVLVYGPIGVGSIKMQIHKACIRKLFQSNDAVLDAESIFEIAKSIPRG